MCQPCSIDYQLSLQQREKSESIVCQPSSSIDYQQSLQNRINRVSAIQQHRLSAESATERENRINRASAIQQQRLAVKTVKERETGRLSLKHESKNVSRDSHLPLLEQHHVHKKMSDFHKDLAAIETPSCSICMEKFPGMKVNSFQECLRCKHLPKLYSCNNNMHPGPVPIQVTGHHHLCLQPSKNPIRA